jgi:tRNA-Thr(GGU) m(6)t(6)A37 methyltransferase TsaA
MSDEQYIVHPIGTINSTIKRRGDGPKQGREGAPDAWIDVHSRLAAALDGVEVGDEIVVITWLHRADRDELVVRPRGDPANPMTGVFATRSPDRPNPLGLHRVKVLEIDANRLKVGPIEAIDGTPVVDIKPVLNQWIDY